MVRAEAIARPHCVEGDGKFSNGHNILFGLPQVPHLISQFVQDCQGRRLAAMKSKNINKNKWNRIWNYYLLALDLVCKPVTSVSFSFLSLSFLRDRLPYILSRLPQLVM